MSDRLLPTHEPVQMMPAKPPSKVGYRCHHRRLGHSHGHDCGQGHGHALHPDYHHNLPNKAGEVNFGDLLF